MYSILSNCFRYRIEWIKEPYIPVVRIHWILSFGVFYQSWESFYLGGGWVSIYEFFLFSVPEAHRRLMTNPVFISVHKLDAKSPVFRLRLRELIYSCNLYYLGNTGIITLCLSFLRIDGFWIFFVTLFGWKESSMFSSSEGISSSLSDESSSVRVVGLFIRNFSRSSLVLI